MYAQILIGATIRSELVIEYNCQKALVNRKSTGLEFSFSVNFGQIKKELDYGWVQYVLLFNSEIQP